ncbi:hypothetical protein RDWZM_005356, partial [Blomia tropicalis]
QSLFFWFSLRDTAGHQPNYWPLIVLCANLFSLIALPTDSLLIPMAANADCMKSQFLNVSTFCFYAGRMVIII